MTKNSSDKNGGLRDNRNGLSRRDLMAAGAGSLALAVGGNRAFAAGTDKVLKVGFISPRTGPLGGFGDGVHRCLGSNLASLQGDVLLKKLVEHFSELSGDPSRAVWW